MNFKSIFNFFVFGLALVGSSFVAYLFMPIPKPQPVLVRDYYFETENVRPKYQTKEGLAVLSFLKKDVANGNEINRKMKKFGFSYENYLTRETIGDYANFVEDYVNSSSSLDDSDLPKDVQIAYKKHLKVWRDYSNFLNELDQDVYNSISSKERVEDFSHNDKIKETWNKVLDCADKYYPNIRAEVQ